MTCNIQDPITREDYAKDPRNVARKAEAYMKSTGIADTAKFGPEAEFFVFDDVRFDQNEHEAYYHVDSSEGQWNRGRGTSKRPATRAIKIRHKEGYFPMPAGRHAAGPAHRDDAHAAGVRRRGRRRSITKSPPAASAKSTCGTARCCRRPTTCCATSTSSRTSPPGTARRRRSCPSRSGTTTAPACTCTSRCGRTARRCSPAPATAG